jgi:hypothetical protein
MDMSDSKMRKITIDHECFRLAFDRDVDYHDPHPLSTYLNVDSGDIIYVYEDDEDACTEGITADDNRAMREGIEAAPEHYLEIPGLHHGDHHKILREFLDSDWTEDEETRSEARNMYFGSIGGWKKSLDDKSIFESFCDFRDDKTKQLVVEFLRGNGIEPQWR